MKTKMETVLLQIINDGAYKLIEDFQDLGLIVILEKNGSPKLKLSERFAGALRLSTEEYDSFQNSIALSRNED
jgi:hypothetical protein